MSKPIIVLDFGHGGTDPGAVGNGLSEKNIVLDIGLKVGKLLESAGAIVRYTRTTDVFIPLAERTRLANTWNADLFVSLHVNSATNPSATGFESFVHLSVNGGKTVAYQNVIHRKLADVFKSVGVVDRGQKKGNLHVLRETKMPAVLLEYGFINNVKDAALLKDSAFIDKLAKATAEGIAEAVELTALPTPSPTTLNKEAAEKVIAILGATWNATDDKAVKDAANYAANALRNAAGITKG